MPRPKKAALQTRVLERDNDREPESTNGHIPLRIRELSSEERTMAFKGTYDTEPYVDFIRSMEPNKSYAIGSDRGSARSTRVRLTKVAKQMGVRLRWAKVPDNSDELIVELYATKR